MSAVTAENVRLLLGYPDSVDVTLYMDTANIIRTDQLSTSGYSTDLLNQMELYLAAHYAVISEESGGVTSKRINKSEEEYREYTGSGLSATRFGQQVIALDTDSALSSMYNDKLPAVFRVIGTT